MRSGSGWQPIESSRRQDKTLGMGIGSTRLTRTRTQARTRVRLGGPFTTSVGHTVCFSRLHPSCPTAQTRCCHVQDDRPEPVSVVSRESVRGPQDVTRTSDGPCRSVRPASVHPPSPSPQCSDDSYVIVTRALVTQYSDSVLRCPPWSRALDPPNTYVRAATKDQGPSTYQGPRRSRKGEQRIKAALGTTEYSTYMSTVVKFGTTPRSTLIRASLQIDSLDRCATSRTCPIVARSPCVSSRTFIAYCSLLDA